MASVHSVLFILLNLIVFSNHLLGCTELPDVSPKFLWTAINMTLVENKIPWHCPKLVFHSNDSAAATSFGSPAFGSEYAGFVSNIFVCVTPEVDNEQEWEYAEQQLHLAALKQIHEKLDPCLVVISFVFNSTNDVTLLLNPVNVGNELQANASVSDLWYQDQEDPLEVDSDTDSVHHSYSLDHNMFSSKSSMKYKLRHRVADLLQYSTPVKARHLMLARLSMDMSDLRYCTRAAKYPVRLVPEWEMVLFDFFSEAHVIQGLFYDDKPPYVKVGKELGKWKWLCEDVIRRLELERQCRMNHDCLRELNPEYYEKKMWMSPPSGIKKRNDVSCKHGYRPRQ